MPQPNRILIVQAVTPGTIYEEMAQATRRAAERLGYGYHCSEIVPSDDLRGSEPPCTFKPAVVRAAIVSSNMGDWVVWLDADAILFRSLDGIASDDWDVAVTLRERHMIDHSPSPAMKFLNAGVIAIQATAIGLHFAYFWGRNTINRGNDQWGLNDTVGGDRAPDAWRGLYGQTIAAKDENYYSRPAARVHILDAVGGGWNNWIFPKSQLPAHTRVGHFKGDIKTRVDWRALVNQQELTRP